MFQGSVCEGTEWSLYRSWLGMAQTVASVWTHFPVGTNADKILQLPMCKMNTKLHRRISIATAEVYVCVCLCFVKGVCVFVFVKGMCACVCVCFFVAVMVVLGESVSTISSSLTSSEDNRLSLPPLRTSGLMPK